MNLPSYDEKGCINMHEVMMANPKDFEEFGIDVVGELVKLKIALASIPPNDYSKRKADYLHETIDEYSTGNGRMRKPFYQHSAMFCFYYNLFCRFVTNTIYYNMEDSEEQKMDQEILEILAREIRLVKNPN